METQKRGLGWKSILWSAVLILTIPLVVNTLATAGYAVVVGFQTRGAMDVITEKMFTLASSAGYLAFFVVFIGVVAFWRGRTMAKKVDQRAGLHIIVAVILAMLVRTMLASALSAVDISYILPWLGGEWLVSLGSGWLGAYLASRKSGS